MKKILRVIPVFIAAIAIFAASTFSWLIAGNKLQFPNNFSGSAKTAYFASGDGSKEHPYIISNPVHLYNLAWLQYLGYFNLGSYINNGRAQSFFKMEFEGTNLNMNGLAIPPIGTSEYPFFGNFDGNGKTISNIVVSNSKNDLVRRPLASVFVGDVLNTTRNRIDKTVDILGLFGVTGDFNSFVVDDNYTEKTVLVDNENRNVTVYGKQQDNDSLVALPDGDVAKNELYYSAMSIKSFYADIIEIKSVSQKVLLGLAAGYVSGTIENVGIYRSKVTVEGDTIGGVIGVKKASGADVSYDSVISNYSIVGDYDDGIVGWVDAPDGGGSSSGDDGSWGGSIDMKMINRRVNYMYTEDKTDSRYLQSSVYNATIYLSQGSEYYWNSTSTLASIAYLKDGTYLPLNVDAETMMLDQESGTGYDDAVTAGHTNAYYHTRDEKGNLRPEIVNRKTNSGYLVGYGTSIVSNSDSPRLRIQGVNGIANSLNGATNTSSFNGANLTLLTTNAKGDTIFKIEAPSGTPQHSKIKDYSVKPMSEFKYYDSVRQNFIDSMQGKYKIHGFHFVDNIPASAEITSNDKLTVNNVWINGTNFSNYELIKGGLNFSVKSDNMLRVIAGTYYRTYQTNHSLFDLFKVSRDSNGNITGVERIERIYQNASGITYNTGNESDLVIDLKTINVNKALSQYQAAYYFEIPVVAGDYLIGGVKDETGVTAYLMYLDIGANGQEGGGTDPGGDTKQLPYIMKSVDFVAMPNGDTSDVISVPTKDGSTYYPNYADVGFRLSANADIIYYKREGYDSLPADDGEITSIVYYYRNNQNITITTFPTSPTQYGAEDDQAKWETD